MLDKAKDKSFIFVKKPQMSTLQNILQQEKPTFLNFYAKWCGPCQSMTPVIEDIREFYGEKITYLAINVDVLQDIVAQFKIQSVPTYIVFKNGEIQWKQGGMFTRSELKTVINKALTSEE